MSFVKSLPILRNLFGLLSPTAMPCYLQRVKQALMKRVLRLKCRGRSLIRCATISSWTDTLTMTNRTQ